MRIHILGICGTFMAGLAILAKEKGYSVSGQDQNVYPPMSTNLENAGIEVTEGFEITQLPDACDIVVIGNVMSRGMPIVEHILKNNLTYYSGPSFLEKFIVNGMHMLVVTGTHGKTTTTSMLAHILDKSGLEPGFLIGGIPNNFDVSARIGGGKYFVIEGDEYDSAFFDKNSKFLHYSPNTLILNNIEFDHADIFNDLEDILRQFHHLLRIVPGNGKIIYNVEDQNIAKLLRRGYWTTAISFGIEEGDLSLNTIGCDLDNLSGRYNRQNALAAIGAANDVGISFKSAISALESFTGVKRRLELVGTVRNHNIYSDFAHHPTAISSTLTALREKLSLGHRVQAIVDIGSNSMKKGTHVKSLANAVVHADNVYFFHQNELEWDIDSVFTSCHRTGGVFNDKRELIQAINKNLQDNDTIVIMSNTSFHTFGSDLLTQLPEFWKTVVD